VIAAGFGYTAPALVGSALAVGGLGVLVVSVLAQRRTDRQARAGVPQAELIRA